MKKLKLILIVTLLCFLTCGTALAADWTIKVNDERLDTEVKIIDGRSLIPLRAVGEALGLEVNYDSVTAVINLKANVSGFSSSNVWLNSRTGQYYADIAGGTNNNVKYNMTVLEKDNYVLNVAPVNINGRVYVPVRVVCDSFGVPVKADNNVISIGKLFSDDSESLAKASKLISKKGQVQAVQSKVPSVTADKTNISLVDSSQTIYYTVENAEGEYSLRFEVGNYGVVRCQWGEWNGNTIPLTFIPVGNGETTVTIHLDKYGKSITTHVSVYKPTVADSSSLTIKGIGEEYEHWYSPKERIYATVDSVDYTISPFFNDKISMSIDIIITMTKCTTSHDFVGIEYELFDDNNICVRHGDIMMKATQLNQPYLYNLPFADLKPGHYTLVFSDMMT